MSSNLWRTIRNLSYHPEIVSSPLSHAKESKKLKPILLVIGALGKRKRLDLLAKLNSLLHDDFDLVIAGLPESPVIKHDLISSLKSYTNVCYHWGYVSEELFSYLLDISDVVYSYQPSHLLPSGIIANSIYRDKVIIASQNGVIGYFADLYTKSIKVDDNGDFPGDIAKCLLNLLQSTSDSDIELAKINFSTEFNFSFLEKCFIA